MEEGPLNVVILFTPDSAFDYLSSPFQKKIYADAYSTLAQIARTENILLSRAALNWFDEDTGCFRFTWSWTGTTWERSENVTPDCLYDKSSTNPHLYPLKKKLATLYPVVNHPDFSFHAGSKLLISKAFSSFTKPYFSIKDDQSLINILPRIPGSRVVLKPERGNSGNGVLIIEKNTLNPYVLTYPLLVQEFVDSSKGIPGIMTGLHDLRLIYVNETFIYAYYRTPREGSLLANVAQGGTLTMVEKECIPNSVWPVVQTVQAYYRSFSPKIYTIDLIFDQRERPWIVELNTMPGLYPDTSERDHIIKLYRAILSTFRSAHTLT